ncbi:hypothetical protein B0H67DRAFT_374620 [Lasiosphaeris hirsuta]|uniref:Uncharacterized protein n=1 Tax=Lasiosphaeris hirsuta TaxID=260670 RepID=A0AA40DLI3_9PEZI|nr:hypothetical protein B0H67DRAFT_374620 [Lasiosphaeris hirsuta]
MAHLPCRRHLLSVYPTQQQTIIRQHCFCTARLRQGRSFLASQVRVMRPLNYPTICHIIFRSLFLYSEPVLEGCRLDALVARLSFSCYRLPPPSSPHSLPQVSQVFEALSYFPFHICLAYRNTPNSTYYYETKNFTSVREVSSRIPSLGLLESTPSFKSLLELVRDKTIHCPHMIFDPLHRLSLPYYRHAPTVCAPTSQLPGPSMLPSSLTT